MPGKADVSQGNLGWETMAYNGAVTFPTLAANASNTNTLTLIGVRPNDAITCSMVAPPAHLFLDNAYVSANDTLTLTWSTDGTGVTGATVAVLINIVRVDGANLGTSAFATTFT